ncbi:ABC transporter substrate-binding protein [Sulfurimonas sp. C5]|uniref:ABC transporter substrate-binding protein n=1 Tax=Sulfurimonas sp. C5 TaxID=3036947 RepID=UPI0024577B09|nr:ABC transporter substrate-binding protein [Sulfurimonas sp. C5]MDH4943729.1 ABC transporter substrate-binding protein [Sulfurimonas sp. C5]
MRILIISLLYIVSLSAATVEEKKLAKISLQLNGKYQFEFAGFIAAYEKGFYKDVGLDVQLKEYQDSTQIEEDVLSGISTYGIYNSSTLIDYLKGKPIKLVASFFKRSALVMIVHPEIKSPKDLVNKKILSSTKEDFILNFKPFLDFYNINIDDIQLLNYKYTIDDFIDGKVDGMTVFMSDELYKLNKRGIKYHVFDPSNENLYILQMELFSSADEIKNHPSRAINFRNASIKGWQYALAHKEEIIELIHKKYAPELSKEDLLDEAYGIERLILPYTYDIGSIDKNFLNKQMSFFKKQYNLDQQKGLSNFIFNYDYVNKSLCLSEAEKQYIQQNPVINVCTYSDQYPIDGVKKEKMTGIMSDVFNDIAQTTSLSFEAVPSSSKEDLQQKVKDGECQILSAFGTNSDEYPTLQATKPFINVHYTLISKLDKSFVLSPEELKDKTIVVQMPSFKEYLHSLYPYINFVVENDKNKMVKMVLSSKAYAIASLDLQADYLIDKYGYGKLKINGFLAKEYPAPASIGVQKSEPVLYTIIEKALTRISKDRMDNILNTWRTTRYQKTMDYSLVIKIAGVMGVILLVMLYYQRKLRSFNKELEKQVAEQTKRLRDYNKTLQDSVEQKVEELIAKDELLTHQSKQAVMGEMVSMIAHQWRQPLNTITLQISQIQLQYLLENKLDKEEILKTFEAINATIIYLSDTVDDFKTYFCKDKEFVEIELEELIEKAITLIKARLKDIEVNVEIYESIKAQVYVNELVQVLLNILNNAIDAYEASNMHHKKINISLRQEKHRIVIAIEDNAGGIPKEHLEKLFEPYFSTKGKNGTGLGLYMSQMIIEKHFGGSIKVETEEGRTIFKIYLPTVSPVSQEQ